MRDGRKTVHVDVAIALWEKMRAHADRKAMTMTEVTAAALTEYLMRGTPVTAGKSPEKRSAIDLFKAGFTATQVAAMLRIPYAQAMAEIGAGVDRDVKAGG